MSNSPDLYEQETELQLLQILIPRLRKSFVDIGAERGGFAGTLIKQGFVGTLLEPLPNHAAALEKLVHGTPNRFLPCAADHQDGQAEFHIACGDDGQPLDYFHSLHKLDKDPRVQHQKSITVTCRSLASLVQEGLIPADVGILKTDTEGNDLRVLRGLGPLRPQVILCEFFTSGIYNGWTQAEPTGLIEEASRLGYQHCLAVRRRSSIELVTLHPACFTDREWGNLMFLDNRLYDECRTPLHQGIRDADERLFQRVEQSLKAKHKRKWKLF